MSTYKCYTKRIAEMHYGGMRYKRNYDIDFTGRIKYIKFDASVDVFLETKVWINATGHLWWYKEGHWHTSWTIEDDFFFAEFPEEEIIECDQSFSRTS